ncbi:MAG: integrase [Salibacteraceae bacterium]
MRKVNISLSNNSKTPIIAEYLAGFDAATTIPKPTLTAPWMIGHAHDLVWKLRTDRTSTDHKGNLKHLKSIYWDFRLSDGTLLSDEINTDIRKFFQEITFCIRDNSSWTGVTNNQTLTTILIGMKCFFAWIFLPELALSPRKFFLSRLTTNHIENFSREYVSGGTFLCLRTGERILKAIAESTNTELAPADIFNLNKRDSHVVISYLEKNNSYSLNSYGVKSIDRPTFSNLFNLSTGERYGYRFTLFLRQFEPELRELYPDLLVPANLIAEYPSHKTPLIEGLLSRTPDQTTRIGFLRHIGSFSKLKQVFPDKVPPPTLKLGRIIKDFTTTSRSGTPWIPLPICLELLNKAIGFVINYAEDVIDTTERMLTELNNECEGKRVLWNNPRKKIVRTSIIRDATKASTFNISRVQSTHRLSSGEPVNERDFDLLRREPSLLQLFHLTDAACILLVATLKPLRIDELLSLEYDCLSFKQNDGYWLRQNLAKSASDGQRVSRNFPIPALAAKAITYLQRLNNISKNFAANGKTDESNYLFFRLAHLWVHKEANHASIPPQDNLRDMLALFCDYIDLPLDEYGRRWYVNIHELRKSFLLTFFWMFKHSSLDACRWIAGHSNPDHILDYIQANIPGEEMVEVEAQYAQQQLRLFSTNQKIADMENIETLNRDVCEHFQVKSVSALREKDLQEWLEHALSSGRYKISAYDIGYETSSFRARVAIEINGT